jgi:integrase/recombinase XerD
MAGQKSNRRKAPTGCYWRGPVLWVRFTANGREHRESLQTGDPKTAEARARAIRDKHIGAAFGEEARTWEDAVISWTDHASHAVKPSTAHRYANSLEMVKPWLTGKSIKAIGKADINALVAGRALAVSTATIRRDLTAVASVLAYAEDQDWRDGNPALDKSRRLKERRDPITLPPMGDVEAVMALCQQPFDDLAKVALLTGARLNELVTLERRNIKDGRMFLGKTKTGRPRTVDLTSEAAAILERQPASIKTRRVFHREGFGLGDCSSAWRWACKVAQKAAQREERDFTPHRFHDLRHVFAVNYLRDGGAIYDLQLILGHSSVKTTEIYLAYLTPSEAAQAKAARTKDGTSAAVYDVPNDRKAG